MRGKRELLAEALFKTNLIHILKRFTVHNKLIVLNYHRIRADSPVASSSFDDGLFSVTAEQFFRQMKWLKQHARILSEKDLIEQIITNKYDYQKSKCLSVAITFDDGYYDNYTLAYPILRSLQIPAIFFICTEMISERKLRWWDILAYLIKKCRKPSIIIDDREYAVLNNRQKVIDDLQRQMKEYPRERIDQCLRIISEACEISYPADDVQDRELMTPEQICEMVAHRMTIGSHTHTHQALSSLDDDLHQTELKASKRILEQMTGQPVNAISYPFGLYQYIPRSIHEAARQCGYKIGFTSNFGINYLNQINDMALNRFSGELAKVSTVSLITVWPELFASKDDDLKIKGEGATFPLHPYK